MAVERQTRARPPGAAVSARLDSSSSAARAHGGCWCWCVRAGFDFSHGADWRFVPAVCAAPISVARADSCPSAACWPASGPSTRTASASRASSDERPTRRPTEEEEGRRQQTHPHPRGRRPRRRRSPSGPWWREEVVLALGELRTTAAGERTGAQIRSDRYRRALQWADAGRRRGSSEHGGWSWRRTADGERGPERERPREARVTGKSEPTHTRRKAKERNGTETNV